MHMTLFTVSSPHFFRLTSCSPLLVYDMMFEETLHYHMQQTSRERNWLVIDSNCKTNPTILPAFGYNLSFLGAEVKQNPQLSSGEHTQPRVKVLMCRSVR